MKITIDTSQDSHSDIRKAIKLLESIVGHAVYTNEPSRNIFDDPSPSVDQSAQSEPAPTNSFASMFDSAPAEPEVKKEEDSEDTKVEFY